MCNMIIGITDRFLAFRLREHATRFEQPMLRHFFNCDRFKELVFLACLIPPIGHIYDGVILLQLPEFISFSFSNVNFVIPVKESQQRTIALISIRKEKPEGFW